MSAHVTASYVRNAIGTAECNAMAGTTALTQIIAAASAKVDMALKNAGYPIPASAGDDVQIITLGAMLPDLYGRKGLTVPEKFAESVAFWRAVATGEMQLTSIDPAPRGGVGGVEFTESDPDISDSRPNVMAGLRKVF